MNLQQIKNHLELIADKLPQQIHIDSYVTFGNQEDFAKPNIEIFNDFLHFIIVERGKELERRITLELDVLSYWVFDAITFKLALDFELKNRIGGIDSRRILFGKQESLLKFISENWLKRKLKEHEEILKTYPFIDKK